MKYKIEQKDFDKLKQLDRIEYRQVKEEIEKDTKNSFLNCLLFCLSAYILTSFFLITWAIMKPENAFELERLSELLKIIFIVPLIDFFIDIFKVLKRKKLMEELNSKYFSTSIKPKQRK